MTRRLFASQILGISLLCLLACNQADPDDGSEPTELDGAAEEALPDGQSFYPLIVASTWVYRHEGGDTTWDEEVTLSEGSGGGLLLTDTPGPSGTRSESVLAVEDDVVYRTQKTEFIGDAVESTVEYDPGFARFDLTWPLAEEGHTETLTYGRKEWDGAGQLLRDGDRSHTFVVEGVDETVSVPAGEFTGCTVIYRMRDRGEGDAESDEDDKRYWYCPGIGKVREEADATGEVEALVSCSVPGGGCP